MPRGLLDGQTYFPRGEKTYLGGVTWGNVLRGTYEERERHYHRFILKRKEERKT